MTDPVPDPLIGRTLGGTYRVEARIGEGATGVVYRARHVLLGQPFAVKVLHPELAGEEDLRKRLLKEARALTLFAHEHAVQVRHLGEDEGLLYLAMDLCEGRTLEALLQEEGPLEPRRAVGLALQILDALAAAHRAGLVHRDLKPGNVVVQPRGDELDDQVRVLDFGLARVLGAAREQMADVLVSIEGDVVGTIAYMSPEQIRALPDVDGRADLFAVGVMLYEMLVGRLPFRPSGALSMMSRILEEEPRPFELPTGQERLALPLAGVLGRALEKDRIHRFQDAETFSSALRDALHGIAPHGTRPPRGPRRGRGVAAVLVGVLLALGAVLIAGGLGRARQLGEAAREAAWEGREDEALTGLGRLAESGKARGEDLLLWGDLLVTRGDARAERALELAERALPKDPRTHLLRARFLWRVLGRYAEARIELGRALTLAREQGDPFLEAREERVRLFLDPGAQAAFGSTGEDGLELAEQDVRHLELRQPESAAGDLMRALLLLQTAATASDPAQVLEAAERRALVAAEKDVHLADALRVAADAAARLAMQRTAEGRHEEARRAREAAEAHGTEALRRALDAPAYRMQGATRDALYRARAIARLNLEDGEGWLADIRASVAHRPTSPEGMLEQATALRFAGRYAEAIERYEILRDLSPDRNVAFDLAFCWQMEAVTARQEANPEGARWRYRRAIELYGEGLRLAPAAGEFVNYRAECETELADLVPAEREALLEAAGRDFETALARATESPPKEVLIRRAAWQAARGDVDASRADMEHAVGDRRDLNPRFYAYLAMARLAVATRDARADRRDLAMDSLTRALEAAEQVIARSAASRPAGLRIRALTRLGLARLSAPTNARGLMEDALSDLERAAAESSANALAREENLLLAAEARLLLENPAGTPRATREREEALARGRWARTPAYFRRLAEDLEAHGDAEDAARARAYGTHAFPEG